MTAFPAGVLRRPQRATPGSIAIQGTLNSTANTTFTLEFFSNTALDATGFGEGENPIGTATITTDGSGNATFAATFLTAVAPGRFITATATNPSGSTSEFSGGRQVTRVNQAPVITNPGSQNNAEGDTVTLQIVASDSDGDTLIYSASGLSLGLSISPTNGLIAGALGFTTARTYPVTASVSDGNGGISSSSFTWTVTNTNRAPALTNPANQVSAEGDTVTLQIVAGDPDGDTLTYSATGLPAGLTRILQDEPTNTEGDGNTAVDGGGLGTSRAWVRAERTGTPSVPGNGRVYEIFFTVSDGRGGVCSGSVKVGVPHDQGHGPAIDDMIRYDSTVAGGPRLN